MSRGTALESCVGHGGAEKIQKRLHGEGDACAEPRRRNTYPLKNRSR